MQGKKQLIEKWLKEDKVNQFIDNLRKTFCFLFF
jgi:hypothetical protein